LKTAKLYHIRFWLLALCFFTLAGVFEFFLGRSYFDINIHDTYFVMAQADLFILTGLWFGLCGLGYWILFKLKIRVFPWMHWVHFVLSLLPFLMMSLTNYISPEPSFENLTLLKRMDYAWFLVVLGFLVGQTLYFLNILVSTLLAKR
jgi:heme/copper-type cytochrome/quinol oxidase subunit 1